MAVDLRVKLGEATLEKSQAQVAPPWPPAVWHAAIRAYENGWVPEPKRFPVLIGGESAVASAEQLKALAGLDAVPDVMPTNKAFLEPPL